jgi:hypothetical protein
LSTTITLSYTRFLALPSPAFPNRTYVDRPVLATKIDFGGIVSPQFYSIIDSGADSCVFPSVIGQQIGIDIYSGRAEVSIGAAGGGSAYYHSIQVHVRLQQQWVKFNCYAGFLDGLNQLGFGLLGHHGFFDLFESVTLDSKRKLIVLSLP